MITNALAFDKNVAKTAPRSPNAQTEGIPTKKATALDAQKATKIKAGNWMALSAVACTVAAIRATDPKATRGTRLAASRGVMPAVTSKFCERCRWACPSASLEKNVSCCFVPSGVVYCAAVLLSVIPFRF